MTDRGSGNPLLAMAFAPRFRMGPPPRSFAADAHDCIVVSTLGSAEYKFVARDARPMASSPRYRRRYRSEERGHGARVVPNERVCRCARSRQGQVAARWPSATLDRRSAQRPNKIRSGRGDVAGPIEQGDAAHNTTDRNRPIQVQGRRAVVRRRAAMAGESTERFMRRCRRRGRFRPRRRLCVACARSLWLCRF